MSEKANELDSKLNVTKVEEVKLISGGAGEKFYTTYELKPGFYIGKNDAIFGGNGTNTKMVEAIPGEPAVKDKNGNIVIAEVPEVPARPESSEVFIKCISEEVAVEMAARIQDLGFVINDMAAIFEAEGWFCFSFTAYADVNDEPGSAKKIWREAIRKAKASDEGSYNFEGLAEFEAEKKAAQEAARKEKQAEKSEGVARRKEIRRIESAMKKLMKPIDRVEIKIEKLTEQLAAMQEEVRLEVETLNAELEPLVIAEEAANPKPEEKTDDPDNETDGVNEENQEKPEEKEPENTPEQEGKEDQEDAAGESLVDEALKMDEELAGDDSDDDGWPDEFED